MTSGKSDQDEAELDRISARQKRAIERRLAWEPAWRDCYAYALPQRETAVGEASPGNVKTAKLFDGTAPDGVERLAASLLAELTPPWSRWFSLEQGRAADGSDVPDDDTARMLEGSAERVRAHFERSNFAVEMMLRPSALSEARLDPSRLIPYDAELDYSEGGGEATLRLGAQRLNRASCWWDPAYGDPERGDGSVIACVLTDEDGNRRIHAIEYITFDPKRLDEADELTQQCEKAIAFADRNVLPRITVETNGLGRMVPGTLRRLARERGLAISVREQSNRTPKALRILDAFDAALAANRLYAHADVLASPLISEMRDWRPDTDGPDDGLDAVAGCLLEEPYPLPAVPAAGRPKPRRDWRRGIKPATARTDFAI